MKKFGQACCVLALVLLIAPATVFAQWTQINPGTMGRMFSVDYQGPDNVFMTDRHGKVYNSQDGGQTWAVQSEIGYKWFTGIDMNDDGFGTLACVYGDIYYTNDNGVSWQPYIEGMYADYWDALTIPGTQTAYVVGKNALGMPDVYWTTDGWVTGNEHTFMLHFDDMDHMGTLYSIGTPDNGATLYATAVAWDGTGAIVRATDPSSWSTVVHTGEALLNIAFNGEQSGLAVGDGGVIYRSTDDGDSWQMAYEGDGRDLFDVAYASQDEAYAVGEDGLLLQTLDGGQNWTYIQVETNNDLLRVDFSDATHGVIVGDYNIVLLYGDDAVETPVYFDINAADVQNVPGEGGMVTFDASLTSVVGATVPVRFWTEAWHELGTVYGPGQMIPFTLQPFMDFTVYSQTQYVPEGAPPGYYTVWGCVGVPNGPFVADGFYIFKMPPLPTPESGEPVTDWDLDVDFDEVASQVDAVQATPPAEFALGEAYPNPFNPSTSVAVTLPQASELTVQVFDVNGRRVADLAGGQFSAGQHTLTFDASGLSSGVYFVVAQAAEYGRQVRKVTLMK